MNSTSLSLFLFAALMIAVVPGPGIFYVMARTLSGVVIMWRVAVMRVSGG